MARAMSTICHCKSIKSDQEFSTGLVANLHIHQNSLSNDLSCIPGLGVLVAIFYPLYCKLVSISCCSTDAPSKPEKENCEHMYSLIPRLHPAFRRLQYGKAIEGLE